MTAVGGEGFGTNSLHKRMSAAGQRDRHVVLFDIA